MAKSTVMTGTQISHLRRRLQEIYSSKTSAFYQEVNKREKEEYATWHKVAAELIKKWESFQIDGLKLLKLYADNHSHYFEEKAFIKVFPEMAAFDKMVKAEVERRNKLISSPTERYNAYCEKLRAEMNRVLDTAVFENAEDAFKILANFEKFDIKA